MMISFKTFVKSSSGIDGGIFGRQVNTPMLSVPINVTPDSNRAHNFLEEPATARVHEQMVRIQVANIHAEYPRDIIPAQNLVKAIAQQ